MSKKELIPQAIVDLLNYRVNQEERSSRLYFAMHEWLDGKGYFGASRMLNDWSSEETYHAGWAREFLESYDFLPKVDTIGAVQTEYVSLTDVLTKSYKHEVDMALQVNDLAATCVKENCFCALPLALRFAKEQTEELKKTSSWLDRLALVGDDPRELMMIDREMGGNCEVPSCVEKY